MNATVTTIKMAYNVRKLMKKPQHVQFFETLLSSNSGQGILRNSAKRIMSKTKSEM